MAESLQEILRSVTNRRRAEGKRFDPPMVLLSTIHGMTASFNSLRRLHECARIYGQRLNEAFALPLRAHVFNCRAGGVQVGRDIEPKRPNWGRRLGVARSTIQNNLKRLTAAGLKWPLADDVTDEVRELRLFGRAGAPTGQRRSNARRGEPDWAALAREMKRPGVTITIL